MRTTRHARWLLAALAGLLLAGGPLPAPAGAAKEIHFWHAMTGALGERVTELVQKFNAGQKEFEVKALHKGNYTETLTGAIAAYRAKTPPHIVQVFEVGTQTMLSSGAVYPVYQLMKDQGMDLNWADFVAPVKSYYSKEGHLYSMPFNSSTPILYYNRDIFKKAGLDPAKPPTTFPEIEQVARKVITSGAAKCGFSHAWPSWTMVENMHAWHDQPFADNQNGFAGLAKELKVNGEFGVKVIDTLARWQKEGIYTWGGRGPAAEAMFRGGECAIHVTSSAFIGGLSRAAAGKFEWGTGNLPRMPGYPQGNSIIGGATLWVMKGHKGGDYKGVATFFRFLASTEQQAWWHQNTGYIPISNASLKALEATDHFQKNPFQRQAFQQISSGKTTANSQGIRLGNFVAVRDAIEGEMENIFAGKKAARQGLDDAVKKSNEILKEFGALYQ